MHVTGGPVEWIGKSMKDAHRGRGIKEEHFISAGGMLLTAMEELRIPEEPKIKLLEIVSALRNDIVDENVE